MSTIKRSKSSLQRQKWEKIFSSLIQMLKTQHKQLETLVLERKFVEDRIQIQHDQCKSDTRLHQDLIRQLKADLVSRDLECSLEASKIELNVSLMRRESFLRQIASDLTNNELRDFEELFSLLSSKISHPSDVASSSFRSGKSKERTRNFESLNTELQRLRNAYEKLASERSSEVNALLAEKTFVWNQYNIMESDYECKLRHERTEVELAHTKIENLLANRHQLESLNNEKDCAIEALESKLENMEFDSRKLKEEIARISHELGVLRKNTGASITPLLNRCTSGYGVKEKEKGGGGSINVRKKASSAQASCGNGDPRKEDGSLKRKRDATSDSNISRLFTSSFRPPKLRSRLGV